MTAGKKRLAIIADDLTGALDASGYLARSGLTVTVYTGRDFALTGDVVAFNTGSRNETAAAAAARIKALAPHLTGAALFKKIDSTLRGNIAPEISALLESLPYEKAVITPAFPALGRTVVDGRLLVDGVPVAETAFARDPRHPVTESSIPALLARGTGLSVGSIRLADVTRGAAYLSRLFINRPERILVCDAAMPEHLRTIARAALPLTGRIFLAGSGGLAREAGRLLARKPDNSPYCGNTAPGPALLVVGSRHPASAGQIRRARRDSAFLLLELDTIDFDAAAARERELNRLTDEAGAALRTNRTVLVTSTLSPLVTGRNGEVVEALAAAAGNILAECDAGGLFLAGGDTAEAVCARLGVTAIRVTGEIQSGMPAGEITFKLKPLRLATKAGGFGGERAIIESLPYLERGIL